MELSKLTAHGLLFLTLGLAGEMTILPCLSEAALVIQGATTGAAVEATLMVSRHAYGLVRFKKCTHALLWKKLDGDPRAGWICLAAQPLHAAQWPSRDTAESGA